MTPDLLREKILGAKDMKRRPVSVPEWGTTVYVKTLSGTERDAFEASITGGGGKVSVIGMRARLAAATVVTEQGEKVFKDSDIETLSKKNGRALSRIFDAASKLNGLSDADVEELLGNSESVLSDGSASDSPSPLEKPSRSSSKKSTPKS